MIDMIKRVVYYLNHRNTTEHGNAKQPPPSISGLGKGF